METTNRILEVLETKGRSIYWLAKNTGISYPTLWRYCRNITQPGLRELVEIASALGIKESELIKY